MRHPNPVADSENLEPTSHRAGGEWASALLPVCFGAAMAVAMMSVQAGPEVPLIVHLVLLGVVFAIAFFLVSKFSAHKFPAAAQVLEGVGVFSMVTAFFAAVSIPLPLMFKVVNCAVYVISFLAVLICSCL